MTAYTNHGKTSSTKRNGGRKPELNERDRLTLKRIVSKILELPQQRWQQNSVFILKTLFLQKESDDSFTNPTSVVQLRLLNLWLLTTKWC